ncbi:MAG TPA: diacylglycerol kinase family protein [Anaeromyxobacteraceae bacterium]|jgi:diacylglycerol kinase family enzyme|nr:diacylglycerol kinase family protein [Anaeromyxobacteraceae bacterium]
MQMDATRHPLAVLLNANAKQVNGRVRQELADVVPHEHLFFSKDPDDARAIADTVIRRGYGTVFTGGGDGTFVSWVNHILDRSERRSAPTPRFGVLALGTGNAVAEVVGARADTHVADLRRFMGGEVPFVRPIGLLTCNGRRTPFAGVGLDAAVINDYNWWKERVQGTRMACLGLGPSGYGLAVAMRTVPRYLAERRPAYCEIVNEGRAAWQLDAHGAPVGQSIRKGELLYAGPCMMAAASTVPYYGLKLKAFPFADQRPGMMQVRVATEVSVPSVLMNLRQIWDGSFSHPGLLDFHAESVSLRFERPVPLQVGGDAEGWRDEVRFAMASRSIDLVDFSGGPGSHRLHPGAPRFAA